MTSKFQPKNALLKWRIKEETCIRQQKWWSCLEIALESNKNKRKSNLWGLMLVDQSWEVSYQMKISQDNRPIQSIIVSLAKSQLESLIRKVKNSKMPSIKGIVGCKFRKRYHHLSKDIQVYRWSSRSFQIPTRLTVVAQIREKVWENLFKASNLAIKS